MAKKNKKTIKEKKQEILRILKYAFPYKKQIILGFIFMWICSACSQGRALLLESFMDKGILNEAEAEELTTDGIIKKILDKVKVP